MSCVTTNLKVQDLGQSTDMPTPSVNSEYSEPSTIGESSPIQIMPCVRTGVFSKDSGQQRPSSTSATPILTDSTAETGLYQRDSMWKASGYLPDFGLALNASCEDSGEWRLIRTSNLATRNQASDIVLRATRTTQPGRIIRH
jgi:hypothetical protein